MIGEFWSQANLKGLYHLNGNSTDSSGNVNNGTDTAITYALANGKFGQGAGFNGSSSRIQCNDSDSLSITGNFTIILWVNPTSLPTSGNLMSLVSKYDTNVNAGGYEVRLYNNSGTQSIGLATMSSASTAGGGDVAKTLPTGIWSMVTGVYDGSNSKIYVNGIYVGQVANTANPGNNNKLLNIGDFGLLNGSEAGRYFNGKLDEVAIFSRALSASEIKKWYDWSKGKYL